MRAPSAVQTVDNALCRVAELHCDRPHAFSVGALARVLHDAKGHLPRPSSTKRTQRCGPRRQLEVPGFTDVSIRRQGLRSLFAMANRKFRNRTDREANPDDDRAALEKFKRGLDTAPRLFDTIEADSVPVADRRNLPKSRTGADPKCFLARISCWSDFFVRRLHDAEKLFDPIAPATTGNEPQCAGSSHLYDRYQGQSVAIAPSEEARSPTTGLALVCTAHAIGAPIETYCRHPFEYALNCSRIVKRNKTLSIGIFSSDRSYVTSHEVSKS